MPTNERLEEMKKQLKYLHQDLEQSIKLIWNNGEHVVQCRRMQILNKAILLLMEAVEEKGV